MTINISVWRLAAHILISILILNTIITKKRHAEAELSVISLWDVTVNKTESCNLGTDNNLPDVVKFTGDPLKTCSIQITSSNGTTALILIPQGALVYMERQEDILKCQMKYVLFPADESCFFVSLHPKLQLFLHGNSANDSSITISQMRVNTSAPICSNDTGSEGKRKSTVSQANHCQVYENDDLISCNLSSDYTCSFEFPVNCNVTLGNRVFEFQCYDGNVHSSHTAITVYPTGIIALDLANQSIVALNLNPFMTLKALKNLSLAYNYLIALPRGFLSGLENLENLTLRGNRLRSLEKNMFKETNKLSILNLRDNSLTVLPKGLFMGMVNLEHLNLWGNLINSLHENLFNETSKLTYISFYKNNLFQLSNNLFKGLSSLLTLDLDDNNIIVVNKEMFRDLLNLRVLHLRNNRFVALNINLFQHTLKIRVLDLSGNRLVIIPDISKLRELFYLNVKGNKLTDITDETFSDLPNQTELVAGQHEICECYVSKNIICTAVEERSPFLTCDRLLSDRILVVVMWLIGLNAIGGNIFVLSRRQKIVDKNKVQTFLLRNLAMSDLLMGFYNLLIASADIYFGEYFPMQAEAWRSGITCKIAGTISIVSSEASVFFVTMISIDRFVSIKYHSSRRRLERKSSAVVASVLWIIALLLGVVSSSVAGKNDLFYDNSHVCIGLPLSKLRVHNTEVSEEWTSVCVDDDTCYWKQLVQSQYVGEINGMIFASVMFLGLNFFCYLIILACYVEIIKTVLKSSRRAGLNSEMKEQVRLTTKVAAIVLTDFACWFPIIIIGILVQAGVMTLPADVFAWCVTFVLPINSAINPYLYTIAAIINNRRKQARIAPVENQQGHTNRASSCRKQMSQSRNRQDTDLNSISHDTPPDESNV